MAGTPESRGRRGQAVEEEIDDKDIDRYSDTDGYVSSSVATSFDYGAMTEEEKQRILGAAPSK